MLLGTVLKDAHPAIHGKSRSVFGNHGTVIQFHHAPSRIWGTAMPERPHEGQVETPLAAPWSKYPGHAGATGMADPGKVFRAVCRNKENRGKGDGWLAPIQRPALGVTV